MKQKIALLIACMLMLSALAGCTTGEKKTAVEPVATAIPAWTGKDVFGTITGLDPDSVFVCGGEQTYQLLLPYCNKALVTLNDSDIKADRFFPNLNLLPNWILTEVGEKQYENQTAFRFLTYTNTDPLEL